MEQAASSPEYLVAVQCITYKHEKFLRQALDGFALQKTNFRFIVVVANDCSPDGTAEIMTEYRQRYPDLFLMVNQPVNLGPNRNGMESLKRLPPTKYLALCEGDDFWCDPLKLQKQVDYMESHPECSICFHRVREFYDDGSRPDRIAPSRRLLAQIAAEGGFTPQSTINHFYLRVNSCMFRRAVPDITAPAYANCGDVYVCYLYSLRGTIGYLPDVMSAYRIHGGGIASGTADERSFYHRFGEGMVRSLMEMRDLSPDQLKPELERGIDLYFRRMVRCYWLTADLQAALECERNFPELYMRNLPFLVKTENLWEKIREYRARHGVSGLLGKGMRQLWIRCRRILYLLFVFR